MESFGWSAQGHQSWECGGSRSPDFGQGGRWGWVAGESWKWWTGREILLYLIMCRKYVRKWWPLKRNWIICQEVAVNGQFLPGNSIFFNFLKNRKKFLVKFTEKIKNFRKFAWKNRNFLWNCLKIEIFRKFAWKNQIFFDPDPRPPDFKPEWRRWKRKYGYRDLMIGHLSNRI